MIRLAQERCVRTRSPRASCTACREACPREALALAPLPCADERCDGCGICAAACPTDAIELEEPLRVPHDVVPDARGSITISCSAVEPRGTEVPCLGSLPLAVLFELAAQRPVCLVRGDCSRCERRGIEATLLLCERVAAVSEHVETIDIVAEVAPRRRTTSGLGKVGRSRRALFGNLLRVRREKVPIADLKAGLVAALRGRDVRIPPCAGLFFRFGAPARCDGCGVCADLCPTQALEARSTDEARTLSFDAARCCGCRLCTDVCNADEGARLEAADWISETTGPDEIVTLARRECGECGFDVFVRADDSRAEPLCFVCLARQQRQGTRPDGKVALRTVR